MSAADLIQELRDGLEGVTPGPWKQFRRNGVNEVQHGRSNVPVVAWSGFDDSSRPEHEHAANAAHIARCHPENIRTLLDALASKDTALAEIRAELAEALENVERYVAVAREEKDRLAAAESELALVKKALADIELELTLADGVSRGYDLKPALAKIRSISQDVEERS